MNDFRLDIQLRWSDLDPNFHLRHSVYYDWGALCRVDFLNRFNLNAGTMQQYQIGPILFREECVFKREVVYGDKITIDLKLIKTKRNYSRWSIQHTIRKNEDIVSAIVTVDGAWINTKERKLAVPPGIVETTFSEMPRDENFQWVD
jgi:acyl-CoA thioester hydrolase